CAPLAIVLALFTVSAAILQGINEQRFAIVSLSAGFIIKLSLNSVLIHTFGAKGSIFATALAVGIASFLNLWRIKSVLHMSFVQTYKRGPFLFIFSILMHSAAIVAKCLLGCFMPFDDSRRIASVKLAIGVFLGINVDFY